MAFLQNNVILPCGIKKQNLLETYRVILWSPSGLQNKYIIKLILDPDPKTAWYGSEPVLKPRSRDSRGKPTFRL